MKDPKSKGPKKRTQTKIVHVLPSKASKLTTCFAATGQAERKGKGQKKGIALRSKAIASRLEAIASRLEAIAIRLEASPRPVTLPLSVHSLVGCP